MLALFVWTISDAIQFGLVGLCIVVCLGLFAVAKVGDWLKSWRKK